MNLTIGPKVDAFRTYEVTDRKDYHVVIRGQEATFHLLAGKMSFNGEQYRSTYVIEIEGMQSWINHEKSLPLGGFGQQLYYDYGLKAAEIAREFCTKQGLRISTEITHWPTLQLIAFVPR